MPTKKKEIQEELPEVKFSWYIDQAVVEIWWIEYTLDSNPITLVQELPPKKMYNANTNSWDTVAINYINVDIIRDLLDKLVWIRKLYISEMEATWVIFEWEKTFSKWDKDKWWKVETKTPFKNYEFKLTIDLETMDWRQFNITKKWVFSEWQISNMDSYRWAQAQLEAIALKALVKYLWRVFRVSEIVRAEDWVSLDDDEIVSGVGNVSTKNSSHTKTESVAKESKSVSEMIQSSNVSEMWKKFRAYINEAIANWETEKVKLVDLAKKFQADNSIKSGSKEKAELSDIFVNILNTNWIK